MSKHKKVRPVPSVEEITRTLTATDARIAIYKQGFKHFMSIALGHENHPQIIPISVTCAKSIEAALSKSENRRLYLRKEATE
jgi:hypothetical protein